MNDVWLEPEQILQNKCRGRHNWESFEEAYIVPGLGKLTKNQFEKLRTCIIAFTMIPYYDDRGRTRHSYSTAYGHNGAVFVKSFKDGILETTRNEIEAKHFYSDNEADKVLEYLRDIQHPWTIALRDFEGNKSVSACVHYPNFHWNNNGNLQPALIHKTVQEWHKEHE